MKWAKPGTTLYYSVLFTEPSKKEAIIALHCFYHELESILDKCTSTETAYQRFQWWRGELHRLFNGTPEHEIGKILAPIISSYHLPKDIFFSLIDGIETKFMRPSYATYNDMIEDAHHSWSLLAILIAYVCDSTTKENLAFAREAGELWLTARNIKRLPWDLSKQRMCLPQDMLDKHHLSSEKIKTIFSNTAPDNAIIKNMTTLLRELIRLVKNKYQLALQKTDTPKKQLPNLIYTSLELAEINKIENTIFSKKLYPLEVNPLKKWWIATKTAKS